MHACHSSLGLLRAPPGASHPCLPSPFLSAFSDRTAYEPLGTPVPRRCAHAYARSGHPPKE
ncbi:hypothetical protein IF2G_10330 [Cordyceps javanica]|nr:hypothetical protein IF2G_10330 [Cordyceps javanica]